MATNIELSRSGREYIYWPFWSSGALTAVDIKVDVDWVPMVKTTEYSPDVPVAAGAQWFRALVAGPLATSNPAGTAVMSRDAAVMFRIQRSPEVIIRPGGNIVLVK